MRKIGSLIVGLHLLLAPVFADDELGILVIPDFHMQLPRLATLVKMISKSRRKFQAQYPNGTFVVVFNGDDNADTHWTSFKELNGMTSDYGDIVNDVKAELSHTMRVIDVVGNHDFDYVKLLGDGWHKLYYEQKMRLQQKIALIRPEEPYRILGANLDLGEFGEPLFAPHADITLKSGKRIRVAGMVFDKFRSGSNYDWDSPFQLFTGVRKMENTGRAILRQAATEGIEQVVFAVHDGILKGRPVAEALDRYQQELASHTAVNRRIKDITHKIWLFGHEHERHVESTPQRLYQQCGSHGDACLYVVDTEKTGDTLYTTSIPFIEQAAFAELQEPGLVLPPPDFHEELAATMAERKYRFVQRGLETAAAVRYADDPGIFVFMPPADGKKSNLKKGPTVFGSLLADALVNYGTEFHSKQKDAPPVLATIGFYNSSSCRWETELTAPIVGRAGVAMFIAGIVYPHCGQPTVLGLTNDRRTDLKVTGAFLQKAFTQLRQLRAKDKVYTPQLSSNCREEAGGILWVRTGETWAPIQPKGLYGLVVDDHLGADGYEVDSAEWRAISKVAAAQVRARIHPPQRDVLEYQFTRGSLSDSCVSRLLSESAVAEIERLNLRDAADSDDRPPVAPTRIAN
ncbi:metallophosphoesterase [bacterium]|nr:metallophosphoesterase [bacterium]